MIILELFFKILIGVGSPFVKTLKKIKLPKIKWPRFRIKKNKILIIGSGGREHAIVNSFLKSEMLNKLYLAPGNDGMFYGGQKIDSRLERIEIRVENDSDIVNLVKMAKKLKIDLIFVGPERPLSLGIVDVFEKEGLSIVGPSKEAAQLESSKSKAKDIMASLNIPIPEYAHFDNPKKAEEYIRSRSYPVVVKADGLAAGKGSLVTNNYKEAIAALDTIMIQKKFGDAGNRVVIEKRLDGEEFSFFAFCDGETITPMVCARDYKPAFDDDLGPNTGGMGGYSPYRVEEEKLVNKIMTRIAQPLIEGCHKRYGFKYKGILYIGGTFLHEGKDINPYVFEINVRMGDPEAQVIYPRLKTDMIKICMAIVDGKLAKLGKLDWSSNYCVGVCAVSGKSRGKKGNYKGYPNRYAVGKEISGLESVSNALVFHSGTKWDETKNCFVTDGGRVLTVVTDGSTLEKAREKAYTEIEKIKFDGIYYRQDIGLLKEK